ncbi:MAG: helix-turn-helix transcriptional regulator [Planctomycetes bacterium]|nr:helix-turn-helix transcriptional regulator [Planctomycetota bacterium]
MLHKLFYGILPCKHAKRTKSNRMNVQVVSEEQLLAACLHANLEILASRYHARADMHYHKHTKNTQHFMLFVEHGFLQLQVNEEIIELKAGEAIWMQPQAEVCIIGNPHKELCRHINFRFVLENVLQKKKSLPALADAYYLIPGAQTVYGQFNELLAYHDGGTIFDQQRWRIMLAGLCLDILTLKHERSQASGMCLHAQQRQQIQRYIAEHIEEPMSPDELAQHMNLSLDYFTRCFRQTYGVPPRSYLVHERMREAAIRLVTSSETVRQIAQDLGIADANYFCRQFKKVLGCTPSTYRARGHIPDGY